MALDVVAPALEMATGASVARTGHLVELGKDARLQLLTADPLNVETPLALLDQTLTPVEQLFMRNNHPFPANLNAETWSLTIDGLVRHPVSISYDELRKLPTSSYVAVLECSGNGRKRFAEAGTPAEGLQWSQGAVANAEWIGVPMALLLERAGVKRGALQAECWSAGDAPFARGVEIAKLMDDAMLAYAVNGRLLPMAHGGPVRLVVPGWGGINWVKWISRMTLISHESESEYNQSSYVLYDEADRPYGKVRQLVVKSLLTNVEAGAVLAAGRNEIRGFAWSGGHGIAQVEMSTDGGASWQPADLLHDLGPRSWRGFAWQWEATPGSYLLATRATDHAGNTQPLEARFNRKGYLMNAVQRVPVIIQ